MKNVFKVFEFDVVDVLVQKNYNFEDQLHTVSLTVCDRNVSNHVNLSFGFEKEESRDTIFNTLTHAHVKRSMKSVFEMMGINPMPIHHE